MIQPASGSLLIPGYKSIQDTQRMIRLEGNGNYTLLHLSDQANPLLISQTLKYFELQLPAFIRVSKSFLINPAYVDRVIDENAKTMYLTLTDGVSIRVSRRRIGETQAKLFQQISHFGAFGGFFKRKEDGITHYHFGSELVDNG